MNKKDIRDNSSPEDYSATATPEVDDDLIFANETINAAITFSNPCPILNGHIILTRYIPEQLGSHVWQLTVDL